MEELGHVLAVEVEIGSPDLDPESFPGLNTLPPSYLSLVTVASSPSTVQLMQFTLRSTSCAIPLEFVILIQQLPRVA